jgi:phosphatidate cytidylyltransferase
MTFARRLFTSAVLISLIVWMLFFAPTKAFSLVATAFVALALYEFFTLLRAANIPCYRLFGVVMGAALPLVVAIESGATQSGEVLFIVIGCLFLFILQFSTGKSENALIGIALTLFGILYISWFLSFVVKMRYLDGGAMWVAYLMAVTKSADIGAYCFGSLFGRHPLIPHVSPKKSVEGLFGGLALSVAVSALFFGHLPREWSMVHLLILGLLIGIVGQIGDLSESLMKRFCKAKDSGGLLPGMGGVMDALDSILFTAPIFYFHLTVFG